jgi:hypothetical protein
MAANSAMGRFLSQFRLQLGRHRTQYPEDRRYLDAVRISGGWPGRPRSNETTVRSQWSE